MTFSSAPSTSTTRQELALELATGDSVRPFGELISIEPGERALPTDFYDGAVRLYAPAAFRSDHDTELALAVIDRRPLRVRWMERHFKHTQAFIPLQGRPFVMVLAPPTADGMPQIAAARALLFDGSAGFCLKIGTWHEFPFALVNETRVIVILRHETTANLMQDAVVEGEAHGPDLDKKDIVRRTGVELRVVV